MMPYTHIANGARQQSHGRPRRLIPKLGGMALPPPPFVDEYPNRMVATPVDFRDDAVPLLPEHFNTLGNPHHIAVVFKPVLSPHDIQLRTSNGSYTPPVSPNVWKDFTSPRSVATSCDATESMTSYSRDSPSIGSPIPSPSYAVAAAGCRQYHDVHNPTSIQMCLPVSMRTPSPRPVPFNKRKKKPSLTQPDKAPGSRKQKEKTELCWFFKKGTRCPYFPKCRFAHGNEELQKKDTVDVESCKHTACFTWLSTGACPFGYRCKYSHDPRIKGPVITNLPHTETQGNSIGVDINVDRLHQNYQSTLLHNNPFGPLGHAKWCDFYGSICNMNNTAASSKRSISELHKLSIILQMRDGPDFLYKFLPQNLIFGKCCMILKVQAFVLRPSGEATPIPVAACQTSRPDHVKVRKIAFGPDSDPSVRDVALWFNIPESEIVYRSPHEAERIRSGSDDSEEESTKLGKSETTPFDVLDSFRMFYPHCRDSHDLVTEILKHRLCTLRAQHLPASCNERSVILKSLHAEGLKLGQKFVCLKRHWEAWSAGESKKNRDGDSPSPDRSNKTLAGPSPSGGDDHAVGSAFEPIWRSFVDNTSMKSNDDTKSTAKGGQPASPTRRLPVFERLQKGMRVSPDARVPHIKTSCQFVSHANKPSQPAIDTSWKPLLLEDSLDPRKWAIIYDHFRKDENRLRLLQIH